MITLTFMTFPMARAPSLPDRDYSVLTSREYVQLKNRSKPQQPDAAALAEIERRRETHHRLKTTVSGWHNTVESDRREPQRRLQREAYAEEQRRVLMDEEEEKVQKLKREAKLAEARTVAFPQRSEVRDVNFKREHGEVEISKAKAWDLAPDWWTSSFD